MTDIAGPIDTTHLLTIVTGTYWWNKQALNAFLTTPDGPPRFIWDFDRALTAASASGARLVAWSSRLTLEQEQSADEANVPIWRIEDGFLRSIGLGAGFVTAASLALDSRGIYYDATRPSDLEHLLETAELTSDEIADGARIRQNIVDARLTKYNLSGPTKTLSLPGDRPVVLVPGQVADDASILRTASATLNPQASENINTQLLIQARQRNSDAFIIYKPHPDVIAGLRIGHVSAEVTDANADLVTVDTDIIELIDRADVVETISSLAGFEALLRGKSVTTHGLPFYAGWGLSNDLTPCPRRTRQRSIGELTVIAFTRYTRHMNPYTGLECTVDELIEALVRQRTDRRHRWRNAVLKQAAWLAERVK